MKSFLVGIGDKIQAAFPPNRVCLLLAGPIAAASLWLSGWASAHVPGAQLSSGEIAGAMFFGTSIVVTLLYKWYDRWQQGEAFHVAPELEAWIDELETKLAGSLGAHEAVANTLADLHATISRGDVNEAQVAHSIEALHRVVAEFLDEHAEGIEHTAGVGVAPAAAAASATPPAAQEPQKAPATPEMPAQ